MRTYWDGSRCSTAAFPDVGTNGSVGFIAVGERVGENLFFVVPESADEGDNHLLELAVAGAADRIVTYNYRHLSRAELKCPGVRIVSPASLLKEP